MKVISKKLSEIIPYERNNRIHDEQQIGRIAASIKEFGFNQPLVIDEKNTIIVGHGRYFAAQKLGIEDVPVLIKTDLNETQKKAYRILDNKLQNDSTWDFQKLEIELDSLEAEGFSLEDWGLEKLEKLFPENEIEEDGEWEPISNESYLKNGDLLELGHHKVLCGDSSSFENVQKILEGSIPFLMVTDPPYGVDYDPKWRLNAGLNKIHQTRAEGKVNNDTQISWREVYKNFPGAIAYVWHTGKYAGTVQEDLESCNFNIRSQIIWAKTNLVISRGHYHWQHEPCWYAVRNETNADWTGDRKQSTLWQIPNMHRTQGDVDDGKTKHSTQKPIECMARAIRNHGKRKDIVYDPFLGSGTTLIAAEQLDRICYGLEIDPSYCQIIIERYENYCVKNNKPFVCKINGKERPQTISADRRAA